jgi:DNA-binding transcriptional LysR family regulator
LLKIRLMKSIDEKCVLINMMFMNIRQMEVFRAVMSTGSVSAAAQLLHVTPPGVSRMMKHLQQQLQVSLFEKQGNRLAPTADARLLYREVERVYGGIEQVSRVAQELKSGKGQLLRVMCSPSLAMRVAPATLARLLALHPDLQIQLEVQPIYDIYQALLTHQCDVAVSLVPIEHPRLRQRRLARVGMVVAMPLGHPLAQRKRLNIQDVARAELIRFPVQTTQGATLMRLMQEQQLQVRSRVTVKTAREACALVAEGVGIAVIDAVTARGLDTTRLQLRPLQAQAQYDITALWALDFPLGSMTQRFIDELQRDLLASLEGH